MAADKLQEAIEKLSAAHLVPGADCPPGVVPMEGVETTTNMQHVAGAQREAGQLKPPQGSLVGSEGQ